MKLLNFKKEGKGLFGLVVDDCAVSFEWLGKQSSEEISCLKDIHTYLENLPHSFDQAMKMKDLAQNLLKNDRAEGRHLLSEIKILPPIPRPAALIDFGLSPRHLINSAKTMLKHEFGPLKGKLIAALLARKIKKSQKSNILMYYKGNHLSIIGDGDEIGWPRYTSYLDIEPELAIITGNEQCPIAGYTIFNDASARDVQFPEMTGTGPARSKDFPKGNGLGPFLVTPDEIKNPLSLSVTVKIGNRFTWKGNTSEYTANPERVVDFFKTIFPLVPGVVLGMGTVPDCTGLDNDCWINPGELVTITFDSLGTLRQQVPRVPPDLEASRWKNRSELLPG